MGYRYRAVAVILNAGGTNLDEDALASIPLARVRGVRFASGDRVACAAATVDHECPYAELRNALRSWACARGWSVTVAPLIEPE